MNQSISYTYLLNIILIFIAIAFMVLMGTLSYTKAFKTNSKIADAIEECEGYNACSIPEINRILTNVGYSTENITCPSISKNGSTSNAINLASGKAPGYCIYYIGEADSNHYSYAITTYMRLDIPVISSILKLRVYAETDRIYAFDGKPGV